MSGQEGRSLGVYKAELGGGLLPRRWPPQWDVLMLQGSDFADSTDNAARGEVGKKVPAWVQ